MELAVKFVTLSGGAAWISVPDMSAALFFRCLAAAFIWWTSSIYKTCFA